MFVFALHVGLRGCCMMLHVGMFFSAEVLIGYVSSLSLAILFSFVDSRTTCLHAKSMMC
jgi:hypothetical protein